jgi:HAD superfamily hydrolase (TIGR01509 family)
MFRVGNIELVIFDMDGLIFDTERIALEAWSIAAKEYGYEITEEVYVNTVGLNSEKTKKFYMGHFGEDFPCDVIREKRYEITEKMIVEKGLPMKEGLLELLEYLKKTNLKRAVATSTERKRACNLLEQAKIKDYFNYVICGDEIKSGKPEPEIFLKVAEKLGVENDRCIVLEDSFAGIMAASKAGMMPVMIPDMLQPNEEILKLLHKKLGNLKEVIKVLEEK